MKKNTSLQKVVVQLVKVSFIKGELNPAKVKSIVNTLKTLSVGNAINSLSLYLNLLKGELDKSRLIIETPVKLSQEKIDEITEIIQKQNQVTETEIIIKPELLGGLRIRIGDKVFEDSISDRIAQIGRVIYE